MEIGPNLKEVLNSLIVGACLVAALYCISKIFKN